MRADALGSIYAITDATGAVVRRNEYEVYGARTTSGPGPALAFSFTGREHDATGLGYFRDRYMDPSVGRWQQADRAGTLDGLSLYRYVRAQPAMVTDPSGMIGMLNVSGNADFLMSLFDALYQSRVGYQLYLQLALGSVRVDIVQARHIDPREPATLASTDVMYSSGCGSTGLAGIRVRIDEEALRRYMNLEFENARPTLQHDLGEVVAHELGHAKYLADHWDQVWGNENREKRNSYPSACAAHRTYREEMSWPATNELNPDECGP